MAMSAWSPEWINSRQFHCCCANAALPLLLSGPLIRCTSPTTWRPLPRSFANSDAADAADPDAEGADMPRTLIKKEPQQLKTLPLRRKQPRKRATRRPACRSTSPRPAQRRKPVGEDTSVSCWSW